jgi:hypothetical protein
VSYLFAGRVLASETFLTLGIYAVYPLETGIPALIIVTRIFPFIVSATLMLVYAERVVSSDSKEKIISSSPNKSKRLSAYGTIYLVIVLILVFVIYRMVTISLTLPIPVPTIFSLISLIP